MHNAVEVPVLSMVYMRLYCPTLCSHLGSTSAYLSVSWFSIAAVFALIHLARFCTTMFSGQNADHEQEQGLSQFFNPRLICG